MSKRDWNFYWDADGEPWAIFLHGHDHDLRTLKSATVMKEMRDAWFGDGLDESKLLHGNLNIGRWWIRDMDAEACDPDHPWDWCEKDDEGAIPITGARF